MVSQFSKWSFWTATLFLPASQNVTAFSISRRTFDWKCLFSHKHQDLDRPKTAEATVCFVILSNFKLRILVYLNCSKYVLIDGFLFCEERISMIANKTICSPIIHVSFRRKLSQSDCASFHKSSYKNYPNITNFAFAFLV